MKNNIQSKNKIIILIYSVPTILLLAVCFNNCSQQFKALPFENEKITAQINVFSEEGLREQLEEGTITINLIPATGSEASLSAANCTTTNSIFQVKYLGLSSANTVYGTVVDLCSDVAPKISVSWISDGDSRSQVDNSLLLPVDYILVKGVYRTVYLFHYQIVDPGASGLFWVTGYSAVDANYALEVVSADRPVYYQAGKDIDSTTFQVRPRVISPLNSYTVASQQPIFAGSFCVLAIGSNLVYEWSKVGESGVIFNSTRCLTFNPAFPSDSGSYRVRIMNSLGEEFSAAQLNVNETPPAFGSITPNAGVITLHPSPVPAHSTPALNMCVNVVAADSDVLSFTWEEERPLLDGSSSGVKKVIKSGQMPQGVREDCFSVAAVSLADNNTKYYFKVLNTGGVAAIEFKVLVKDGVPVISAPIGATIDIDVTHGDNVDLIVDYLVPDANESSYSWELVPSGSSTRNLISSGTEIPSGTSSTLPLTNLQMINDGDQYIFTVLNSSGDTAVRVFDVSVSEPHIPPAIVTPPQLSTDVQSGVRLNQALCFVVEGYPLTDYKIYHNGVEDAQSTLTFSTVSGFSNRSNICLELPGGATSLTQLSHSGLYRFEFKNDSTTAKGQVDSASTVAKLAVLDAVQIIDPPGSLGTLPNLTLAEGTSVGDLQQDEQYCVVASGSELKYQWARRELTESSTYTDLPGQISACLNIPLLAPTDSARYRVRVSNRLSGKITSIYEERKGEIIVNAGSVLPPDIYELSLISRYYIDEAASGPFPSSLIDAAPNPVNLPISNLAGVMTLLNLATGSGLVWPAPGDDSGACVDVSGTKFFESLDGSTSGTLEAVTDLKSAHTSGSRLVHIGYSIRSAFSLEYDGTEIQFDAEGTFKIHSTFDLTSAGRTVVTGVFDSSLPNPSDRVKIFINGLKQPIHSDAIWPTLNATLDLSNSDTYHCIGNRAIGGRSIEGSIFYGAVYQLPLPVYNVSNSAMNLLANDDSDQVR